MEEVKSKIATQYDYRLKYLNVMKKLVQKYLRETKRVKYKSMLVISNNY